MAKCSACQGLHFIQLDQSHPMTLCKYEKRTDMSYVKETTPISETTNQEHTSRGRHKVFNKVENPHHAASPKESLSADAR